MKIGIMSMHRVKNLGSFMQAYGLKSLVESLGHEVVFIDYIEGEKISNVLNFQKKKKINKFYDKLKKILSIKKVKCFKKDFNKYYNDLYEKESEEYLNITKEKNREQCDVLIVGSDEVFNCLNNQYGFSDDAFGGYKNSNKIISYAASCGWTKYDFLTENQKKVLEKSVPNFSAMSVRDNNTKDFISNFYNKEININLDPVLISDFSSFNKKSLKKLEEKYIIIYAYYNRISSKDEISKIKKFAKQENCKLVAVGSPQYWCDEYVPISPYEIFDFFHSAQFVITDTFHGTIFSIKSHCKFLTIIRESNKNKLSDLLQRLALEERMYNSGDISKIIKKEIDYKKVDFLIEKEKEKTVRYLKENLK